jgi:hypothetical protein
VFVVGCQHSGTSIMARLLNGHPDIYTVRYESQLFALPELRVRAARTYSTWLAEARSHGKSRVCEKSTSHVFAIERIFHNFPSGRVVQVFRDGRDVVCSLHARGLTHDVAVELWTSSVRAGLRADSDPRVHSLRYEDLVLEPRGALGAVCAFLNEVDASDEMLKDRSAFTINYRENPPEEKPDGEPVGAGHLKLRNWQINQPLYDGRGRWSRELSPQDLDSFLAKGSELLVQLGYE